MIRLFLHAGSMLAWTNPENLPAMPRAATYLIAIALVAIWMILRIQILRRRDAFRAEEGEPPLAAWRWLRWLADSRYGVHVLTAIALSLLAAAGVLMLNAAAVS